MTTLYATISDLREVLDGTDAGTGTASQLTDIQLTLALRAASSRISVYFGAVMDSSSPQSVPPDIFHDLALDIAAWYATTTYLKHKAINPQHPVWLRYSEAMKLLEDVRSGRIRLDPGVAGGAGEVDGVVINRIPPVFTGRDSNTAIDPATGSLVSSSPPDTWTGRDTDWGSR